MNNLPRLGRVCEKGVVPLAVEVVAADGPLLQDPHLLVADLDTCGILALVQLGVHDQTGAGGGVGKQVDDDFVAGEGATAPVHGDLAEQPVFDFVPFAGSGRQVAHGDLQSGRSGELGQLDLPQPGAVAVGAATVGADQQPARLGVGQLAGHGPPAADGGHGELGGVVVAPDRHPAGVGADVVDPVGDGLAQLLVQEVVHVHRNRLAGGAPLAALVGVAADQLLLLDVHADRRATLGQVRLGLVVEVAELGVPV